MELFEYTMPDQFTIVLGGDWHIGARACNHDAIAAMVDRVDDDPHCYFIHMGDIAEAITVDDKRYNPESVAWVGDGLSTPAVQYMEFEQYMQPIVGKTLGVLEGNHDEKMTKRFGNLLKASCVRLQVPYGTYSSRFTFNVNNHLAFKLYAWHGRQSVMSRASTPIRRRMYEMDKVVKVLDKKADDCSVLAMGHVHLLYAFQGFEVKHRFDDGENVHVKYRQMAPVEMPDGSVYVPPEARHYLVTGTTLETIGRGYSTYAERAGYPDRPDTIGWTEVHYNGGDITTEVVQYE